jgi:hypothetical protein
VSALVRVELDARSGEPADCCRILFTWFEKKRNRRMKKPILIMLRTILVEPSPSDGELFLTVIGVNLIHQRALNTSLIVCSEKTCAA